VLFSSARPYSTAVPVSDEDNKHQQVKSDKSSLIATAFQRFSELRAVRRFERAHEHVRFFNTLLSVCCTISNDMLIVSI
jgi:hypothetical protein